MENTDSKIQFFCEDIDFTPTSSEELKTWIETIITSNGFILEGLNYVFCSDTHLHKMNVDYLEHDTLTDIITFDNSETVENIEGDVFISVDRVKENAQQFNKPFDDELRRVLIHGAQHLMGQGDKTEAEKEEMRKKEEACLSLWQA